METTVKIIGILFVLLAIFYFLKPDVIKSMIQFFRKGKRIYLAAVMRFALAIVFLLAARECDITWVIATLGIIFLVSGLLIFLLGSKRIKAMFDWWLKQSSLLLRVLALITLAFGAVIIFSA